MAAIPSSPAVVFLEKDNSAYPPNIESSIVGIIGYATKGPTNTPTLITSQENLINTFGNPSESLQGQGLEGALEILETTNQVRFVRAVSSDAQDASALVAFGVCPAVKFTTSSFGLTSSLYLKVSVRDSEGTLVLDQQTFSIPALAANVNAGISQASAIASIVGVGNAKTDHVSVAFNTNSQGYGYLVGAYPGSLASLTVSAFSSTTYTTPNLYPSAIFTVSAQGTESSVAVGNTTTYGGDITTDTLAYLVRSQYPGTGYNLSTIGITGQTVGFSMEVESNGSYNSLLGTNYEGAIAETFNVSLLDNPTFVEEVINLGTENTTSDFIKGEIMISGSIGSSPSKLTDFVSQITSMAAGGVTVTLNGGASVTGSTSRFVKFKDGTYALSGGTNGGMGAAVITGNAAGKTGMYALDDDLLNISIGIIPGVHEDEVQNAFITLAETSQNFVAVVAPPVGLDTVQEATDWMNGRATSRTAAINNSWAAVFWPHVQVFDIFSGKDRWYDPAIFAVRQMAFTDNVAESWFAPAGFRRGRLTKPTATELSLNQGDRDALYVNNINPIVNFVPEGITIFGQKTAQRAATALDRINVRRLMIYLRKVLLQTGRQDLFEPNDAFTWDIVKTKAEAVLSDIQSRRGITDFRVVCDSTVNTPLRVDRNELWCKILIRPTKTAEWIIFEVNLTNQAAKF
jgi:phage tail sheath protein FI